jgi:hypothetical protein
MKDITLNIVNLFQTKQHSKALGIFKMKNNNKHIIVLVLALFSLLPVSVFAAPSQPLAPAGSPMSESIRFQYAVYFLPTPKKDPMKVLSKLLATKGAGFKQVNKLSKSVKQRVVSAVLEKNVPKKYSPPSLNSLKYSGRGLSKKQAAALQKSQQALKLMGSEHSIF